MFLFAISKNSNSESIILAYHSRMSTALLEAAKCTDFETRISATLYIQPVCDVDTFKVNCVGGVSFINTHPFNPFKKVFFQKMPHLRIVCFP